MTALPEKLIEWLGVLLRRTIDVDSRAPKDSIRVNMAGDVLCTRHVSGYSPISQYFILFRVLGVTNMIFPSPIREQHLAE
jgi:hypothetical protein